jgi:hypothetical protein
MSTIATLGKTEKALAAKRAAWLKRKKLTVDPNKALRKFSDSVGIDYNTCCRWFEYGSTPRSLFLEAVLKVYPDWPIE